jgi:indolepyruvate ferredoxin oxidoreductase alpha subunit
MMHRLLTDSPGKAMFLLGNEAIARGALEAGLSFATCYPGTPSSEIPAQFFDISQESDLYFEYSTNEKVAMEVGAAAAVSGLRTMVTLKQVGLNVAADPLMSLAYVGVEGGMVIVNADDPYLFSSQNEQDNRQYARLAGIPLLEPTNAQELKDITALAFDLSERLKLPVLLRTTTRLNHIRGKVELGKLKPVKTKHTFKKNPAQFVTMPAHSRVLHKDLLQKYEQAQKLAETWAYNEIIGRGKWGIVTNGVSFNYVMDAVKDLNISDKVSILKLGFSWPMPEKLCLQFMRQVEKILVVEELEPLNEKELQALAQRNGISLPILGKGVGPLCRHLEYNPAMVRQAIGQYFAVDYSEATIPDLSDLPPLPGRPPNLCAGCPHRATYYAVKEVYGPDAIYPTDIGCYTLGVMPPFEMADFVICMGSSVTSSCGFSRATDQKIVGFIGDSTFFHSGITGLINAVHNNHKFTLVILDNGTTAMTGFQIHPGVDTAPIGVDRTRVNIEQVVRGCGVEDVHLIRPFRVSRAIEKIRASADYDGISVIISEEMCPMFARSTRQAKRARPFYINQDKCKNHRICVSKLSCPAMYLVDEQVAINKNLCTGCTVCAQICPEHAILPLKA